MIIANFFATILKILQNAIINTLSGNNYMQIKAYIHL
jgi:hypothetical protein